MSGLPKGWMQATGAEIFEFVTSGSRGWAQHYSEKGAAFIRVGNLDHHTISLDLKSVQCVQPPDGAEGARTKLRTNDILISITAELGMVGLVPSDFGEAYISQHLALARPVAAVEPRFIAWYLASERDGKQELLALKRGATKVGLGLDDIRAVKIPIAPLVEQKRIADKLDTLLARIDACRERLERVPGLIKRFRQAVLDTATSGRLTAEWRIERGLVEPREGVRLGDVASDFGYGSAAKSAASGSVPVLRMGNIQGGRLDWRDLVYASDPDEIRKYQLVPGDVLFNRTNSPELVGKAAVYKGERSAIFAGYLIRVRCSDLLLPDYLNYCLGSPAGRDYCWQVKSDGVSQSNINAKKLADFRFLLPCVDEQREIVRRVEKLFAFADALESRLRTARTAANRLTPATLSKAFRGELVPQDPTDEPAQALLDRIKAEKETVPMPATKRRRAAAVEPMLFNE